MERHSQIADLAPEEAQIRAAQYRQMAETVTTADAQDALLRLAERYEALAEGAMIEQY